MEETEISDSIHNELSAKNIGDILLVLGLLVTVVSVLATLPYGTIETLNVALMGIAMILAAMALYIRGKISTEQG